MSPAHLPRLAWTCLKSWDCSSRTLLPRFCLAPLPNAFTPGLLLVSEPSNPGWPTERGAPNIFWRFEIQVFCTFALILFLKGYFDKPLPPKARPGPPATFHKRIFPHLLSRPISFLDSPFSDLSKPLLSPKPGTRPSKITRSRHLAFPGLPGPF